MKCCQFYFDVVILNVYFTICMLVSSFMLNSWYLICVYFNSGNIKKIVQYLYYRWALSIDIMDTKISLDYSKVIGVIKW